VAKLIAPRTMRYGREAVAVDLRAKTVRLDNGETLAYRALVSTLPLDRLAALCHPLDDVTRSAAASLLHSSCHVVGVGLRGDMPATLQDKCWMYFPEAASPYYRVTVFSRYSPFNVPAGGGYWSLMAEICETPSRPVATEGLLDRTVSALRGDGLLGRNSEVVSLWHRRLEYGYPTPSLGRDAALDRVLPALEEHGVFSRGRFGAWKYEVSNQDHAFMQGVEVVDRILGRGEEPTLLRPQWVNSGALSVPASASRS
jgi:protoporphyrinogen oxidase